MAAEFLRAVDMGESANPFFGLWFEPRGRKQCGYILGHELVRKLEAEASLKEAALLDDLEVRLRLLLEETSAARETPETLTR